MKEKHTTIAQSAEVAGRFAREKRAEGYQTKITATGSDSKRGTRVGFVITWWKD